MDAWVDTRAGFCVDSVGIGLDKNLKGCIVDNAWRKWSQFVVWSVPFSPGCLAFRDMTLSEEPTRFAGLKSIWRGNGAEGVSCV